MGRAIWILAIALIAVGAAGLVALNMWHAAFLYANNAQPWGTYGMLGPGMMVMSPMLRGAGHRCDQSRPSRDAGANILDLVQ
jgi:hypothetical protein